MSDWDVLLLLRIVIGTVLGGVIGFERDLSGRPAGLRTHVIVALASATFMVVSTHFVFEQGFGPRDLVRVDASRIASSIVTGIGFLAGGAIIRTGLTIQGLTTAAALWLVGAIGMAAGGGMYGVAVGSTLVGVVSLTIMRRLEDKGGRTMRHRVRLVLGAHASIDDAMTKLREVDPKLVTIEQAHDTREQTTTILFELGCAPSFDMTRFVHALGELRDMQRVTAEQVG